MKAEMPRSSVSEEQLDILAHLSLNLFKDDFEYELIDLGTDADTALDLATWSQNKNVLGLWQELNSVIGNYRPAYRAALLTYINWWSKQVQPTRGAVR